jgi:hypothetical protein
MTEDFIPEKISISSSMRPSCSYRTDEPAHSMPAKWLYESPGMGSGPQLHSFAKNAEWKSFI